MILTKLWAALLACLATACLAGMFLLSLRSSTGFSEADEKVIRAVTDAGLAAIAADIQSSPVGLGASMLGDSRLKEAMDGALDPRYRGPSLSDVFSQVANEGILREHASMSVAIVGKDGAIVARTGLEERLFDDLVQSKTFGAAQADPKDTLYSATLGGTLHAVKVSRRDLTTLERRLVSIQAIDLGGGSFFRRVLGTSHPAGLVRSGQLLGDAIGGAKTSELTELVTANMSNVPPQGASQVFVVGEGSNARIGAIGRVPGPAGKGNDATMFSVLSLTTSGARQHDLAQALSRAHQDGLVAQLNWIPLTALLFVALALCFYFPHLECTAPLRRMTEEFDNLAQGRQAQLYQETYNGAIGDLARTAVRAHASMRAGAETGEYEGADYGFADANYTAPSAPAGHSDTASNSDPLPIPPRENRLSEGIDLPDADGDAIMESNAVGEIDPPPPPHATVTDNDPAVAIDDAAIPSALLSDPTPDDAVLEEFMGSLGTKDQHRAAATTPSESGLGRFRPPAEMRGTRAKVEPGLPGPTAMDGDGARPPHETYHNEPGQEYEDRRQNYYREVYEQFVQTKVVCGENTDGFSFDKFARKLEQNTETLMKRDDAADIRFTVYIKNGCAALKARVIKA
ncbi:MAG: MXAN_5187 family protein [Nannocystaceae bacterium]